MSKRKSVSKLWYPGVRWLRLLLGLVLLGAGAPVWAQPEGSVVVADTVTGVGNGVGDGGVVVANHTGGGHLAAPVEV